MLGLISPLVGLVSSFVKGKQDLAKVKQKAKLVTITADAEVKRKVASGEIAWDNKMADASANSWKDEYLTILVSIPLILAFVGYEDVVMRGFTALEAMPDFYKTAVGVVFAASFGVKAMTKMFKK
jgi:hypothetical protein|tara:strand:+ start:79 stop:453 length:375 start_codon:yes stop_codon:yes gene_type:complete